MNLSHSAILQTITMNLRPDYPNPSVSVIQLFFNTPDDLQRYSDHLVNQETVDGVYITRKLTIL